MNPIEKYIHDRDEQVQRNKYNGSLFEAAEDFTEQLVRTNYVKSFTWMGIPILQYPSDLMVIQELIWRIKPRYIIETGTAFGGTAIFYAAMLHAMGISGTVISIDLLVRKSNRDALLSRPGCISIELVKGDSVDPRIVKRVFNQTRSARGGDLPIMVALDSCHTHSHVLKELELYAPLVSVESYIIVMDTAIEFHGHLDKNQSRAWGKGNNPWTAVQEFLETDMGQNFVIDKEVEHRALITSAPDGFLRKVK